MSGRKSRHSIITDTDGDGLMGDPTIDMTLSDLEADEPALKKEKLNSSDLLFHTSAGPSSAEHSLKTQLQQVRDSLFIRLCTVDNNIGALVVRQEELESRVGEMQGTMTEIKHLLQEQNKLLREQTARQEVAINLMCSVGADGDRSQFGKNFQTLNNYGSNTVTLITLNNEEDFPDGSWLGDESNPEMRVRVPLSSADLLHIHSSCRTPEKMALTLLDYLFDRETQAESNLSGTGKHNKKQLDPLLIYGIRCHLMHHYSINDVDWHRIRQNLDSKCRTAFRRKVKGQPLTVKAFRPFRSKHGSGDSGEGESRDEYDQNLQEFSHSDDDSMQQSEEIEFHIAKQFQTGETVVTRNSMSAPTTIRIVTTDQLLNDKVLQASQEQLRAAIQGNQIQILDDNMFSISTQGTVTADDATLHLVNGDEGLIATETEALIATETENVPDVVIDSGINLKFETSS